jgi:hypothetical protein
VKRADSPAWRRTGLRLAAVALATGCIAALPTGFTASALAAPVRHATTSWGHVNKPAPKAKPVVLPGNGRSWAFRAR